MGVPWNGPCRSVTERVDRPLEWPTTTSQNLSVCKEIAAASGLLYPRSLVCSSVGSLPNRSARYLQPLHQLTHLHRILSLPLPLQWPTLVVRHRPRSVRSVALRCHWVAEAYDNWRTELNRASVPVAFLLPSESFYSTLQVGVCSSVLSFRRSIASLRQQLLILVGRHPLAIREWGGGEAGDACWGARPSDGNEHATTMSRTDDLLLPSGFSSFVTLEQETNGYHRFAHSYKMIFRTDPVCQ